MVEENVQYLTLNSDAVVKKPTANGNTEIRQAFKNTLRAILIHSTLFHSIATCVKLQLDVFIILHIYLLQMGTEIDLLLFYMSTLNQMSLTTYG